MMMLGRMLAIALVISLLGFVQLYTGAEYVFLRRDTAATATQP